MAQDGSGDTRSIQEALRGSTDGDTILVQPGQYLESIDFLGRGVLLKSTDGPEVTTIDGTGQTTSVVTFQSNEPRTSVLDGFTITNGGGTALAGQGGGLTWTSADAGSQAGLSYGGGVLITWGSPTLKNNHILGNHAHWGGGMYIGGIPGKATSSGSPLLENLLFQDNRAEGNGGAVNIDTADVTFRKAEFRDNTTRYDGAAIYAYLWRGVLTVEECTFVTNHAGDHGGALISWTRRNEYPPPAAVDVSRCIMVGNTAAGADVGENGSGGALWLNNFFGRIVSNSLIRNEGYGEVACSGGAICIDGIDPQSLIADNLVAFNVGCGIACRGVTGGIWRNNLLWENEEGDLGHTPEACPEAWESTSVFADPQLCDPNGEGAAVSRESPALQGSVVIGAVSAPGCAGTPVVRVTWGAIKAHFR